MVKITSYLKLYIQILYLKQFSDSVEIFFQRRFTGCGNFCDFIPDDFRMRN